MRVVRLTRVIVFSGATFLFMLTAAALADENLDRGVVALRKADGSVYIGWRLLADDPADVAFHVYRKSGSGTAQRVTEEPVSESTNYVDTTAPQQDNVSYFLRPVVGTREGTPTRSSHVVNADSGSGFVRIRLKGAHGGRKVAVADLDGDGQLDYVIKQPGHGIDPWQRLGVWHASPSTYKLEAYRSDGTFMWRYDLGWSIEQGVWYLSLIHI